VPPELVGEGWGSSPRRRRRFGKLGISHGGAELAMLCWEGTTPQRVGLVGSCCC
jgi:hypothetical protein